MRDPAGAKVDIWCLPLRLAVAETSSLGATLVDDKPRLGGRVDSARDAQTRAAPALCRLLVARLFRCDPANVDVVQRRRKPPRVSVRGEEIHVSLSHSGEWIALAVSRDLPIGVDVQRVHPDTDVLRLSRRFFRLDEASALEQMAVADRTRAFFRLWAMKEAVLKGTGGGVPSRLRAVSLLASLNHDSVCVRVGTDRWSARALDAPEGYALAVAVRGEAAVRTRRTLDEDPSDLR